MLRICSLYLFALPRVAIFDSTNCSTLFSTCEACKIVTWTFCETLKNQYSENLLQGWTCLCCLLIFRHVWIHKKSTCCKQLKLDGGLQAMMAFYSMSFCPYHRHLWLYTDFFFELRRLICSKERTFYNNMALSRAYVNSWWIHSLKMSQLLSLELNSEY